MTNAIRILLGGGAALLLTAALLADGGAVTDFGKLVPRTVGPWHAAGEDHVYDRDSLYDYMDGGAEVYLAFDFRQVWARKYAGPADGEMTLDIYDMGRPSEAYGIFSCDRTDPPAGVGQESTYAFGLLRFWQGSYLVTVTSTDESDEAGRAILELGKAVAAVLGPPGPVPDMIFLLPGGAGGPVKPCYFHGPVSLNNRYYIAADNILRLDRSTDCVLAEYRTPAATPPVVLLIVRYPERAAAEAARSSFLAAYLPGAGPDGLARREDKGWVAASLHGACLAVLFDAPDPAWAREFMAGIGRMLSDK